MRIDLNKTIDSVIIICAAIFLIPSTSFAQEDCTPGDMRVCASAYGLVSIQHCIGNNNAAKRICTVEDARYNNIGAEYMACNCGGNSYCLCQPTGACCAMENMGGAPTIEITDGCCGTACFKGQWDECEPIEPPDPDECDEDTIGNPTNVITGNVTYSVNNADVEIHDGNDLLSIWRKYSSQAAMPQSTNTSASLATINWPYLWSPGWSYSFAYTLAYRENNGSGDTLFLRYPNFKTEVLAGSTVFIGLVDPNVSVERINADEYIAQLRDGTQIVFHPQSTSSTFNDSVTFFVPATITEPSGRVLTFTYYIEDGSTGMCKTKSATYTGYLCRIDSNRGAYVYADLYDWWGYSGLVPVNRRLRFGQNSQEHGHIDYNYAIIRRTNAQGVLSPMHLPFLQQAIRYRLKPDATEVVVYQENYFSTTAAYYRPDLSDEIINGVTVPNPYATQALIVAQDGATVPLLEYATNPSGELISKHYYDASGRGVVSVRPGEYLRLLRVGDSDEMRILAVNESTGGSSAGATAEFLAHNDVIEQIADAQGCLKNTASIERDNNGRIIAKREEDAVFNDGMPGSRRTYTYDNAGRIIVELQNWEGTPLTVAQLTDGSLDPLAGPTRVYHLAYNGITADTPQVESKVFSALCYQSPSEFGLTCPASFGEPRIERVFNSAGTLITAEQKIGLSIEATTGNVIATTRTTSLEYDNSTGALTKRTDPLNNESIFTYYQSAAETDVCTGSSAGNGAIGQLKQITFNGSIIEQRGGYDDLGRATCSKDERGLITNTIFDDAGRITQVTTSLDSQTRVTNLSYRIDGKLLAITNGDIGREYTYFTEDVAQACDTQNAADVGAQQAACLIALGSFGQVVSESNGVIVANTLVPHAKRAFTYDTTGKTVLASLLNPSDQIKRQTGFAYDQAGRQVARYKYIDTPADPTDLATISTNAAFTSSSTYDSIGQLRSQKDERFTDANKTFTYDQLHRLSSVTVGSGTAAAATTHYAYDVHDNLTQVTDPDGRITKYLYDDFGQLLAVKSPDSGITRYAYDSNGNLLRKDEPDPYNAGAFLSTHYTYDSRSRLTGEYFNYDWQNPSSVPDREYTYDTAAMAPQSVTCVHGDNLFAIAFEQKYLAGRLAYVRHEVGTTYYSYSPFGEVTAIYEQTNLPASICVTRYSYDISGRIAAIAYQSSRIVHYTYATGALYPTSISIEELDSNGQPIERQLLTNLTYSVEGMLQGYADNNAKMSFSATWDLAGQAFSKTYQGAIDNFDWQISERDGNGNILRVGDISTGKALGTNEQPLSYDDQDRLVQATGARLRGYQDCTYDYDLAGNRTSVDCYNKSIDYSYEADSNRLQSIAWQGGATCNPTNPQIERPIERDLRGRQTMTYKERYPLSAEDKISLGYGVNGRITSVTMPQTNTPAFTYGYNHNNQRVYKQSNDGTTRFVYDSAGNILTEQRPDVLLDYVYINGALVSVLAGPLSVVADDVSTMMVASDHLSTPMRLFDDATGEIVWAADYEAFGRAYEYVPHSTNPPALSFNLRFPGQYYDAETGLHYNWHRYYEPTTGRYLQGDSMILLVPDLGQPVYAYALNNSILYTDQNGAFVGPPPPGVVEGIGGIGVGVGSAVGAGAGIAAVGVGIAAGVGVGIGLGINSVLGDTIQDLLTPLLPPYDPTTKKRRKRGHTDPVDMPPSENPGSDGNGKCKPCPPRIAWLGPDGCHWHWIEWNQLPDCQCRPKRMESKNPPF